MVSFTDCLVKLIVIVSEILMLYFSFSFTRYIEAMVHCASTRHPAAIVDDLHTKVLREAVQNSKTTFSENVRSLWFRGYSKLSLPHESDGISKLEKPKCIKILSLSLESIWWIPKAFTCHWFHNSTVSDCGLNSIS